MRPLRATIRLCRRRVLATLICATAVVGPARTAAAQAGPGRESTLTAPAPSADSLLKRIDALESRVDTVSSVAAWAVDMRNNGLVILSFIGGVLLLFLLFDLWSGRDVTFDSHWGGFGSGTGGFHRLLSAGTPAGSAPLPDALSGFAAAFRFAALSAEAVEARFDRAWRELQQWVAVDEVSWPSVSHETFADYGAQLAATLAKVAATDPRFSLATLQTAAWNSVSTRYLGTLSGSEPEASIEELICWRFGVPPSQIPFSIAATPAFVWSKLLLGARRVRTAPPSMRLVAAHALGFPTTSYERAAAFVGDDAAPFLDDHPELFGQPRERRLVVLCKNDGSLASLWTAPPSIAVLPLTHEQAAPLKEDAIVPDALSLGAYAVLAVEYSADVARNAAFVETVRSAAMRGNVEVPMPLVFFGRVDPALVDLKPYIHLPRRYEDLFPAMHAAPVA